MRGLNFLRVPEKFSTGLPPPVMMPVDVTQVGGTNGSVVAALIPAEGGNPEVPATVESQASWTYDVYAEDGETPLMDIELIIPVWR